MKGFLHQSFRSCWLLVAAGCIGCSSQAPPLVVREDSENLERILTAYQAATDTLQRPPRNAVELRPYLQKLGEPERLLTSPHDGQPYEILWGVDPRRFTSSDPADPQPPLVAHERSGVDGVRYAATALGVMRMTEEEFQKARQRVKKP